MTAEERPPAWEDTEPADRPGEEWRVIPEFEGAYEASSLGRVRSVDRIVVHKDGTRQPWPGQIRKQRLSRQGGYPTLDLRRDGKKHNRHVHRLVLEAFTGPRPEGHEACHGDGDPRNNNSSNLRWDTPLSNNLDTQLHGTYRNGSWETLATRSCCPHGHALAIPNLRADGLQRGWRYCLACQRARGRVRFRLRNASALPTDFQEVASEAYQSILAEADTSHEVLLAESEAWVQNRLAELGLDSEQATESLDDPGGGETPPELSEAAGDTAGRRGDPNHREEAA